MIIMDRITRGSETKMLKSKPDSQSRGRVRSVDHVIGISLLAGKVTNRDGSSSGLDEDNLNRRGSRIRASSFVSRHGQSTCRRKGKEGDHKYHLNRVSV